MTNVYFKNIRKEILKEILSAEYSLKVAVAWFTNNELFEAVISKCKNKIPVELLIINDSINIKPLGLDFDSFIKEGGVLYFGDEDTLMHHKFCIIDNKILINGSYNWTYWAETKNNENITIIKDDINLIKKFESEFNSIVINKKPKERIDYNAVYNIGAISQDVQIDEYIGSATDLLNRGELEFSAKIFEKVNSINPIKANNAILAGLSNNKDAFAKIYDTLLVSYAQPGELSYEQCCKNIQTYVLQGNYIKAISLANSCAEKFPFRFSVHVYCGDAKLKLNDLEGAKLEYEKALRYNHSKGSKIVYYEKKYNYSFFPNADIYLKLGNKEKAISVLNDAVEFYTQQKISKGVYNATNYLNRLRNNEIVSRID